MKKMFFCLICACLLSGLCACAGQNDNDGDTAMEDSNQAGYQIVYLSESAACIAEKDRYLPGEHVVLHHPVAYDDYSEHYFFLGNQFLQIHYDDGKNIRLEFTMPDHDVKMECRDHDPNGECLPLVDPPDPEPLPGGLAEPDKSDLRLSFSHVYAVDPDYTPMSILSVYAYQGTTVLLKVADPCLKEKYYLVPDTIVDECAALIKEYGMASWQSEQEEIARPLPDDFHDRDLLWVVDGEKYTATAFRMPENGDEAFEKIETLLRSYALDTYLVK